MTLFERIKQDQLAARRARDSLPSALLTTLIGDISSISKNNGDRDVTDAEIFAVIKKFIDGVVTSISAMGDNITNADGSADRLVNFMKEQTILISYMPSQMDEALIDTTLRLIINEVGDNLGKVMAELKKRHAGQYDGQMAAKLAKSIIKKD